MILACLLAFCISLAASLSGGTPAWAAGPVAQDASPITREVSPATRPASPVGPDASLSARPEIPIPVTWATGETLNVMPGEETTPGCYALRLKAPVHNWVAGRAFFLPTDKEITLEISLKGQNTRGNSANVSKWVGLRMLSTYADPCRYASYESFVKDKDGRWHSTDPFRPGALGDAGTGRTPAQSAVPEDAAEECLSTDGLSWSAFREIESCEAVAAPNIFRVKVSPSYPTMTVAMRVPYRSDYLQQFVDRLQAARLPGVAVDTIGRSAQGRPLQAIRLDDPHPAEQPGTQRTVLIVAREHATEHASSWVAHGAIVSLLQDTPEAKQLRSQTTWIIIPIFDPDGGADSIFDRLTDRVTSPEKPDLPPEITAYTRYLADYVAQGRTLDVAVSLHNVEANECPNLFCPQIHALQREATLQANQEIFPRAKAAGYLTGDPAKPWDVGIMTTRFPGWCGLHFGSLCLNYEVNDRYPSRRLSLSALQDLGIPLVAGIGAWLDGDAGRAWHTARTEQVKAHIEARAAYWRQAGYGPEKRTNSDLINLAY